MSDRINVLKTYKTYVGGKFPRSESGRYYKIFDANDNLLANACQCSRKDFRDAVTVARNAFDGWSNRSAYNRGQILYRIAEMLEGRKEQFIDELENAGQATRKAEQEVNASIDRLIYYAGWSDKYQQIYSSVNPVASSHFNFSIPEPTGVVSILAPESTPLMGLVSVMAPVIVGGNTCVILASEKNPLPAMSFAEVLQTSDVPDGVVNLLTGYKKELAPHMSSHMDINAVFNAYQDKELKQTIDENAAFNIKRVIHKSDLDWMSDESETPYLIFDFQEIKTTWHPVGF